MAAYRFSAKVIGRSSGRSATAAAAYRASDHVYDLRTGERHDYTRKGGTEHAEVMAPENAPDWMRDRGQLWNAVEKAEKRKDAQLAREVQLSLPHELTAEQRTELVRGFVAAEFVERGMIADVAIHAPHKDGDQRNHHAHVMLTMRSLTGEGFGNKNRDWNAKPVVENWREQWAHHVNRSLERSGSTERVDHRSYAAQNIDREPQQHMGAAATAKKRRGEPTRIHAENHARQVRNGERANLHAQRAQVAAQLAQEREKLGRWKEGREEKIDRATATTKENLRERQERERVALFEKLAAENGQAKASIRGELDAINERLQNARGVKAIVRNVFGQTKRDQQIRDELGQSLNTINQHEARELGRLDKAHRQQVEQRKARTETLKRRTSRHYDKVKSRLEERTARKEPRPPRQRAASNDQARPRPEPANDQVKPSPRPRAHQPDPTAKNTQKRREEGRTDADAPTPTQVRRDAGKRSDGSLRGSWDQPSPEQSRDGEPRERGSWDRSSRDNTPDRGRKPS